MLRDVNELEARVQPILVDLLQSGLAILARDKSPEMVAHMMGLAALSEEVRRYCGHEDACSAVVQ